MKKHIILFVILLVVFSIILTGCLGTNAYEEGLENFYKEISSISLNDDLLPSDTFLEDYPYQNGEYYWHLDEKDLLAGPEVSLIVLTYDQETYQAAKEYCKTNMILSPENSKTYSGYEFIENITYRLW